MNGLGRKNENKEKDQTIFTKETFGVVLILFATLCLICLITGDTLFSAPGALVSSFLYGCFGFFAYAVIIWAQSIGVLLLADKKINLTAKRKALFTLGFFLIAILSHVISLADDSFTFGQYLAESYNRGAGGIETTSGGGFFTALIAFPLSAVLTDVGCYVILSLAIVATGYFLVIDFLKVNKTAASNNASKFNSSYVQSTNVDAPNVNIEGVMDYPVQDVAFTHKPAQKLFVNNPQDFAVKTKREMEKDNGSGMKIDLSAGGLGVVSYGDTYTKAYGEELKKKIDYIKTPTEIDVEKTLKNQNYYQPTKPINYVENPYNGSGTVNGNTSVSDYVNVREEKQEKENPVAEIPFYEHDGDLSINGDNDSAKSHADRFMSDYANIDEVEEVVSNIEPTETFRPIESSRNTDIFRSVNVESENDTELVEPQSPSREDIFRPFATPKEDIVEEVAEENVEPIQDAVDYTQNEVEQPYVQPEENEQPPMSSIIRDRHTLFGDDTPVVEPEVESTENNAFTSRVSADNNLGERRSRMFDFASETEIQAQPVFEPQPQPEPEPEKPKKPAPPINRIYNRPPFDLLEKHDKPANSASENHQERMEIIQRTLEEFHINAVPQTYVQGPSITRYEIMMPAGVSVKNVLKYDDDLKMRLSARDGVRIEAPIPGKNLVGVEVANNVKTMVGFREVMELLSAKEQKKGALWFAIGKDIVGNAISYDLAKGPHYLIAGATGSGKSVCLHVMLVSLLMRYSPEELKLVLVDPKSVEFRKYEHVPHLLVDEIITEPKRALTLLKWAYDETNRRNELFTSCGGEVSNIDDYNALVANDTVAKLPRIVFFIDELADLMESCKKDLEARIRMIAAKSRSAGIHLVLATQRPSVDVITGTIKANLPSRIALKVMTFADSQTILSEAGAEKLLGNGDMLYKDSSMGNYERYQGAYISGREITNVVNYIKENNAAYFDDDVFEYLENETKPKQEEPSGESGGASSGGNLSENDALFKKALWFAITGGSVSISSLQRRFRVGYARAGGLVDTMEQLNYISANEGSKARRVLITREEFINKFGPVEDEGY